MLGLGVLVDGVDPNQVEEKSAINHHSHDISLSLKHSSPALSSKFAHSTGILSNSYD